MVDFPYPGQVNYFSQRNAALRAADADVLSGFYGLPGAVRSGLQNNFAAIGGQFDALSQSSNPLLRFAGNAGFIGSGVLYASAEVALPFDTFGGVAAGAIGSEVLGAVLRIPAVNRALNADLTPYIGKYSQYVLDRTGLNESVRALTNFVIDDAGSFTLTRTVSRDTQLAFRDNGYLDPLTNTFKAPSLRDPISVDHIYPVARISKLDGFDGLTTGQQLDILQDRIDVGNLQPLPQSFNSSKGRLLDFSKFRGQGIDSSYAADLSKLQGALEVRIQNKINFFRNLNLSGDVK